MSTSLVTICVPVFNGERFLANCLDSLLAQSLGDFTLIISDNASADGTEDVARRYQNLDSRVRYFRQATNIGMYANFDFLIRSARTPYLKLANADDFWAKDMLADSVAVMEQDPSVELCYPMMAIVDEGGSILEYYSRRLHVMDDDAVTRFLRVISEIGLVSQMMGVVRTATVQRFRRLKNHPASDRMWVAELALFGKIFQTEAFQYFRRLHPGSSSNDRSSASHLIARVFEDGVRQLRFLAWNYHLGLLERVWLAPLQLRDRLRLSWPLLRLMVWDRGSLWHELWSVSRRW